MRIAALLLMFAPGLQANSGCKERGTTAGIDGAACGPSGTQPRPSTQVLKFKSETTRGQILSPGEKPPATTLEESQKALSPATTAAAQGPH